MKVLLLCLIIAFLNHFSEASIQSKSVLDHLASRTPYRFKANKNDSRIKFPGCKEKKIWMMIRHGTRLPSSKNILGMDLILPEIKFNILLQHKLGKGKLNKEQLERLEAWSSDLDVEYEKTLALEGQDEMVLLAERIQKRFPGIVKRKYDNETFLFRYTATERAQQSARYFANGLFGRDAKDVVFAPATKVDLVLRFYKHCDKWQKQVKKNPETYVERGLFGVSPEMNMTLQHVSRILGFNTSLSLEKVSLMYKTCGFETAWNKHFKSPWCAAFDQTSAEVLEYYFDLKHYWVNGYAHYLTYRQACLSVKNMFDNFSTEKGPFATFFFAHSGTILKMISHLGLYKPASHLTADTFEENKNRSWRTSDIDCFASNLAFVLFDCADGEHVLTLHQEHAIVMPMCKSELCPLRVLTQHFNQSIHNCDYSDMCSLRGEL